MNTQPSFRVNPRLLKAVESTVQPAPARSSTALVLDADVLAGVQAVVKAAGGTKSQRAMVNDLLRLALTTDAVVDAILAAKADAPA